MATTFDAFLQFEPTLAQLRSELATCNPDERARLEAEVAAYAKHLQRSWDDGEAGWLTPGEAADLAAELTAQAAAAGSSARASVSAGHIVFRGGPRGFIYSKPISSVGVIATRRAWAWYFDPAVAERNYELKQQEVAQAQEAARAPKRPRARRKAESTEPPVVWIDLDGVAARLGKTPEQVSALLAQNELPAPVRLPGLGLRWLERAILKCA